MFRYLTRRLVQYQVMRLAVRGVTSAYRNRTHLPRAIRAKVKPIIGLLIYMMIGSLVFGSWQLAAVPVVVIITIKGVVWQRDRAKMIDGDFPPSDWVKLVWLELTRLPSSERAWEQACRGYGLTNNKAGAMTMITGKRGAKLLRPVPSMMRCRISLDGDVTGLIDAGRAYVPILKIQHAASDLAEAIHCTEVIVRPTETNGMARVQLLYSDHLSRLMFVRDLPFAQTKTEVSYGKRRDGSAATFSWEAGPVLLAGVTGSGKSGLIWNMLADLVRRKIPIIVYCSDPKGGMEMRIMARFLKVQKGLFKVEEFVEDGPATVKMVRELVVELRRRQRVIIGRKAITPTVDMPMIIVILDEILETLPLLAADKPRGGGQAWIGTLLSQSRSALMWVWAATQISHATVIGDLRNAFSQRAGLRMPSATSVDTILGGGALAAGAKLHQLHKIRQRGVGWSATNEGDYEPFRAGKVSDRDILRILTGRVPLGMPLFPGQKPAEPGVLYRAYSYDKIADDGTVVPFNRVEYIGKTKVKIGTRNSQHRNAKPGSPEWRWCPEHRTMENFWAVHVDESKIVTEPYPDQVSLAAAEEAAIKREHPYWNQIHNRWNRKSAITGYVETAKAKRARWWVREDKVSDAVIEQAGLEILEGPVVDIDSDLDAEAEEMVEQERVSVIDRDRWNLYPDSNGGE